MRLPVPVFLVVGVLFWWYWPPPAQQVVIVPNTPPPIVQERVLSPSIRVDWAREVLRRLGNTTPSSATISFVVAWTLAEDACTFDCGYSSAFSRNNPLNTTQTGFNETATINGDGVKGYETYEDGIAATVQTLSYGYYTEIVAGLQQNDPERALRGLYGSPWGTSATNVEAIWRRSP